LAQITGCATGIGHAIAINLAKSYKNITLVLWDYNDLGLEKTAAEVRELGVKAHVYCVDVSSHLKVSEAAQRVF